MKKKNFPKRISKRSLNFYLTLRMLGFKEYSLSVDNTSYRIKLRNKIFSPILKINKRKSTFLVYSLFTEFDYPRTKISLTSVQDILDHVKYIKFII